MENAIQIVTAALGALGFGILLRMDRRHLPLAALGGALTQGAYLLMAGFGGDLFFSVLTAAFLANVWAVALAHLRRAPTTVFSITALVPLIPGGGLYETMSALVHADRAAALTYGTRTLLTAGALGAGTLLVAALTELTVKVKGRKIKSSYQNCSKDDPAS